ncbi:MAG: hypothetical protein M3P98_01915 [bacterium]|nr:hypothetical protein [bacterium]
MFKKLISNIPFNPSLITQVSFYSKRLSQENSVRKLGFFFITLSLLVQGFAILSPAEPTIANPDNDVFRGGFTDQAHAVNSCNSNSQNFKTILAHFDITCTDLFLSPVRKIDYSENNGGMYSMGRNSYFANDIPIQIANVGTFYMRPLTNWGAHCYDDGADCKAITGTRPDGSPFWVLLGCGNITIFGPPTPEPEPEPEPEPTPEPKPEEIVCSSLLMNVQNESSVARNTTIKLRGKAAGNNLKEGTLVDMFYELVNADNGSVISSQRAEGIGFNGGIATDSTERSFKLEEAGRYQFKLAVKYANGTKNARGNNQGNCVKTVFVEIRKPCDEAKDEEDFLACIILSKKVENQTQGIEDADGTLAKAGDTLIYTLIVENISKDTAFNDFVVEENISDILEYADIVDLNGGIKDTNQIVRWPAVTIQPESTHEVSFKVQIKDPIPATPVSPNNPNSFDLQLTNVYGNVVNIDLPPPAPKIIELTTTELPNTGPGETLAVASVVIAIAGYFFYRSRLMKKEIEIVKKDYAKGEA